MAHFKRRMTRLISVLIATAILAPVPLAPMSTAWSQQPPPLVQPASDAYQDRKREINENVVTIMASGTTSPYTIFAEDMRDVLDQSAPGGLRILPLLGKGGANNALDVLLLKGVDMGIIEQSDLDIGRQKDPVVYNNVESRLHYITKLANSEFQILAQKRIKNLRELEGQKVNYFKKGSSTEIVCAKIFGLLNIKVEPVYLDQAEANAKLKAGEIAAAARFAGAPHNAFTGFKAEDQLHFLALDGDTLGAADFIKLLDHYSPALLRSDHFPALIEADKPVQTVAGAMLLVVYNWPPQTERYQRVSAFINEFFTNIEKFKGPGRHQKWKEINIAADIPGWTRFRPAREWLDRFRTTEKTASGEARADFDEFLKVRGISQSLPREEREKLFEQFVQWSAQKKTSQR
jgi:TRAP-type uncharacterized transport system substrate-binding protein